MSFKKKQLGQHGETLITTYLKNRGFSILSQNYRSRFGEIDIIAQRNDTIAFVEVKYRNNSKVSLSEIITITKQQKIIKTALDYISKNKFSHIVYRFDVALLHLIQNNVELHYIQNAFTASDNNII